MNLEEKFQAIKKPIMILGTSSGAGKSLLVTSICRILMNRGEKPIPFKGQNMSNNAWVDLDGGEMAYSQALQAFACGIVPSSEMNPILLKPQGNSKSEVIHRGKSQGITTAKNYYKDWFKPGWEVIKNSIKTIYNNNQDCRLIVEGAGSPVEMNLIHRDLTNLRIAKYLNANCILITDIERGGVFAQIVGTLDLMTPEERKLVKGIVINRFRGDIDLFEKGKEWIEKKTNIPVLGVIPYLNEKFPPEDSLDLLEKRPSKNNFDMKIGIIKLPYISNFSDFHPLENEEFIKLEWITFSKNLDEYDLIILPGSKQTIKDQIFLNESGLAKNIKEYEKNNGNIFGICGGLQMLGEFLKDPYLKEGATKKTLKEIRGLGLLPLTTTFNREKITKHNNSVSIWPDSTIVHGFEIHNGHSKISNQQKKGGKSIFKESGLGWYSDKNGFGIIAGTYLHGIFENDSWRNDYLNLIRKQNNLPKINNKFKTISQKRDIMINKIAREFEKHLNIIPILN